MQNKWKELLKYKLPEQVLFWTIVTSFFYHRTKDKKKYFSLSYILKTYEVTGVMSVDSGCPSTAQLGYYEYVYGIGELIQDHTLSAKVILISIGKKRGAYRFWTDYSSDKKLLIWLDREKMSACLCHSSSRISCLHTLFLHGKPIKSKFSGRRNEWKII